MSAVQASGIDHLAIHVRDLDVSKAFYMGVLGLAVDREFPGGSFLKCGTQILGLIAAEGADVAGGIEVNHVALNLTSGRYDDVKAALERAGVEVLGRPGAPEERCIYLKDPDQHLLQLVVPKEG